MEEKLDIIIQELIKIRAVLEVNRLVLSTPPIGEPICNCQDHIPGELTGGWYCPVHGHMR